MPTPKPENSAEMAARVDKEREERLNPRQVVKVDGVNQIVEMTSDEIADQLALRQAAQDRADAARPKPAPPTRDNPLLAAIDEAR